MQTGKTNYGIGIVPNTKALQLIIFFKSVCDFHKEGSDVGPFRCSKK